MSSEHPVVLLVESDIVVRFPVAQYLRQCGFIVVEAVNGAEAKTVLKLPQLRIRSVLADMNTQGVDFTFQRWLREENVNVHVLVASTVDKIVERAGSLCNEGPALAKPYEHHLVRDEIRRAIARRERSLQGDNDAGEKLRYAQFASGRR